jgi:hypothetical protein
LSQKATRLQGQSSGRLPTSPTAENSRRVAKRGLNTPVSGPVRPMWTALA